MKTLFADVKKDQVLAAVAGLVLGLLLLIFPESSGIVICYVCAAAVAIFGIMHLINYFVYKGPEHIYRYDLTQGIVGIALGVFLFISPKFLLGVLPVVLGIVIIIDSVVKLQNAFDYMRMGYGRWWIMLILSVVTCALGVLILTDPFMAAMTLLTFIGISMIVNSVIDLWNIFYLSRRIKKSAAQESEAQ